MKKYVNKRTGTEVHALKLVQGIEIINGNDGEPFDNYSNVFPGQEGNILVITQDGAFITNENPFDWLSIWGEEHFNNEFEPVEEADDNE